MITKSYTSGLDQVKGKKLFKTYLLPFKLKRKNISFKQVNNRKLRLSKNFVDDNKKLLKLSDIDTDLFFISQPLHYQHEPADSRKGEQNEGELYKMHIDVF